MRYLLIAIIFVFVGTANSQEFEQFELILNYNKSNYKLAAGYSDVTTTNFDEEYERDLPPFPPPGGNILPAFRIVRKYKDDTEELIFSDFDYRETPQKNIDTVEYRLDILGTREEGEPFTMFVSDHNLSKKITQVRIIDRLTKGKQVDTNLIDGELFNLDNQFLTGFTLYVIYDQKETDVENEYLNEDIYYSNNNIYINRNLLCSIEVYNMHGQKIIEENVVNNIYNIENLQNGMYFAYIYSDDIVIRMLKIVKL